MWFDVYNLVRFHCLLGKQKQQHFLANFLFSEIISSFKSVGKYESSFDWHTRVIYTKTEPITRRKMLLRKELESLELTYPDESSTVSNTAEIEAASIASKVFRFAIFKHGFIQAFDWFEIVFWIYKENGITNQWTSGTPAWWEEGKAVYAFRSDRRGARIYGQHNQWPIIISNHSRTTDNGRWRWRSHTKFHSIVIRSPKSN